MVILNARIPSVFLKRTFAMGEMTVAMVQMKIYLMPVVPLHLGLPFTLLFLDLSNPYIPTIVNPCDPP